MWKILATLVVVMAVIFVVKAVRRDERSVSAIEMAHDLGQRELVIKERGREYGVVCAYELTVCAEFISRADSNPKLKEALLQAKAADVVVMPKEFSLLFILSPGEIQKGYVRVNTRASDEKIIEFLTRTEQQ